MKSKEYTGHDGTRYRWRLSVAAGGLMRESLDTETDMWDCNPCMPTADIAADRECLDALMRKVEEAAEKCEHPGFCDKCIHTENDCAACADAALKGGE